MGVLNVTPDSFSDGGLYSRPEVAIDHAIDMVNNGADIIDIGGESTRPGSDSVSIEEELKRVIPIIDALKKRSDEVLVSVDTCKSSVAKRAIDVGADIVNDISGLTFDSEMKVLLANNNTPVIIMHINGKPKTMQKNISYVNLIDDIKQFFLDQVNVAQDAGIEKNNIILDPGIGFGKTFDHNFSIIRRLKEFKVLGYPLLIGPSKKAFIGDALNLPPDDRVEGTIATIVAGILNGSNIVRVHNVKEVKRAVVITENILRAK
ncbi:MAG: dihydropteroate synthase [Candidatus Marinimicrobia bacterium]|nr:dihydropteroate synthase [Candidatus Neomarinimicrobiota bacterium]